ncbi:xynB [Symbiodinium sp. CCMP2592]|nr:xynB [Symbiodinium sp. CCMP2592]
MAGCKGLPQGDVFSPLALAACLVGPLNHVQSLTPDARSLLYLDDRTLVARSCPALKQALKLWNELEAVTRLKTHEAKTQIVGRNFGAFLNLQRHGYKASTVGEATLACVLIAPKALWGCLLQGIGWQASRDKWLASTVVDTLTNGTGGQGITVMIANVRSLRTCLICFGIVLRASTCDHSPDPGQRWPGDWVGVDSPTQLRYLCCSKWQLSAKLRWLRGALVTAGSAGVFSNDDLVQLTQLPARLCSSWVALVQPKLARLVTLQEGKPGRLTLDDRRGLTLAFAEPKSVIRARCSGAVSASRGAAAQPLLQSKLPTSLQMRPPLVLAWLLRLFLQRSLHFFLAWLPLQLLQMSLQFFSAWLQQVRLQLFLAWLQLLLLQMSLQVFLAWLQLLLLQMCLQVFLAWLQLPLLQMSLQIFLAWLQLLLLQMCLQFILAWLQLQLLQIRLQFFLAWPQLQLLQMSLQAFLVWLQQLLLPSLQFFLARLQLQLRKELSWTTGRLWRWLLQTLTLITNFSGERIHLQCYEYIVQCYEYTVAAGAREERPSDAYFDWLKDHLLDLEGGSSQVPADNGLALAKALLSGLKQCLNKGGSEDDVLGILADAFQNKAVGLLSRQVTPVEPPRAHETWEREGWENWSDEDCRLQEWSEHDWDYANASWPSPTAVSKPARSVMAKKWDNHSEYWRNPLGSGKPSKAEGWPSLESRYSSVATGVRSADWKSDCPPKLIGYFGLKQSLLNGKMPEGNLVEIWDETYLDELICLWESFDDPFACTVLLSGHACRRDGALVTQLSITRGSFGPALEKVGLLKLGEKNGPWMPRETTVVAKDKVPQIPTDRATIRITAPAAYRQSFRAQDSSEESASDVVRDLALSSGVPVAQLLGGNWSVRTVGESNSLVGFLRVKEATAKQLLNAGGMRGIFVARVGKQAAASESKPFWTKRLKDESRESYFRRVLGLSKKRAQPIIHRSGGGSDLGFPAWLDGDALEARPKHVLVRSVPRAWVDEDVVSFLAGLSWSEVKVTSRVRGVWHVMATPPPSDFPVSSWKYSLEGSEPACVIEVQVAESSARKVAVVAAVKGPSRRLAKETSTEKVVAPAATKVERARSPAPTQLDPPGDGDGDGRGRSRSRERKPPKEAAESSNPESSIGALAPEPKKARGNKTLHDPDAAVLSGWKVVDLQGVGDCFFRCMDYHQARRQKPQKLFNNTEAQTKGAWIRAQAKLHAQNHPETFSALFDSDAKFKSWLTKVGKMTTFAEGAIIQAVSEKLGCPIVAWVKEGCWERFVVSGRFASSYACCDAGQSPAVVLLENKHFTVLTPPTVDGAEDTVPYAWLRETPTIVLDLTGGMVADEAVDEPAEALCDGELGGEATPSLHSLVFSREGDARSEGLTQPPLLPALAELCGGRAKPKGVHGTSAPDLRKKVNVNLVPKRIEASRKAHDRRWELMYKAYREKPWKGAHSINCEADAYDSYIIKSGAKAGQALHRCLRCGVLVRRNKLPESVCELDAKRGNKLTKRLEVADVHVLIAQELNLSQQALAGASQEAKRLVWQAVLVPKPRSRRGGVGLFVRRPRAFLELERTSTEDAQSVSAQLLGLSTRLIVTGLYSAPKADPTTLFAQANQCEALSGVPWIVGLDGNINNMEAGQWPEAMRRAGGLLCAKARHTNRSKYAIDGIWASETCPATYGAEVANSGGDHSIAESHFDLSVPPCVPEWRFAKPPRDAGADAVLRTASWQDCASSKEEWTKALDDLNDACSLWCKDAQKWLSRSGGLAGSAYERDLGSKPSLRSGNHKLSSRQAIGERQLRRHIRRLKEARLFQQKGLQVPLPLLKALSHAKLPAQETSDVRSARFGSALSAASDRLQVLLRDNYRQAIKTWKARIHTTHGACRWLKREEAIPSILQDEQGRTLCQPAEAVKALHNFWGHTFGCGPHQGADVEAFWDLFGQYVGQPSVPFPELPPLKGEDLRTMARKNASKVAGLDGLSPRMVSWLPDEALERLAELLNVIETKGVFPDNLKYWKIAFIPKKRKGRIAKLGEVRPLAIGPCLYRIWASLRLQALAPALSTCLPHQSGGCQGPDAETLVASFELEFPQTEWQFAAMLDYAKAFDSCDVGLCIRLFELLKFPVAVTNLLRDQWFFHSRWLSFSGATHPEALWNYKGLPQGDPFAPVALSLLLTLPAKHAARLAPDSATILYLDDRSLLAKSMEQLVAAREAWCQLETCTRFRTHNGKTQLLARTDSALVEFQQAGLEAERSASMLGVSVGHADGMTADELERQAKTLKLAARLECLLLSHKFKTTLAATVFSPAACWGALPCGRELTKDQCRKYQEAFRCAVKGSESAYDRASRPLQQVITLSHRSDMQLVAAQAVLRTLGRWTKGMVKRGAAPTEVDVRASAIGKALERTLAAWAWSRNPRRWGQWGKRAAVWSLTAPKQEQRKAKHALRESWRLCKVSEWLEHPKRRDSELARNAGVVASPALVKRLHRIAQDSELGGHELSIMSGGMSTDARWCPAGTQRSRCEDCGQDLCPSVDHILWDCPCSDYASLRLLPKPRSVIRARLGWSPAPLRTIREELQMIKQLGSIRAAEVQRRRQRVTWCSRSPIDVVDESADEAAVGPGLAFASVSAEVPAVLPGLAPATASADVSADLSGLATAGFPGLATATASADVSASLPGLVTATASAKESAVFPGLATATASADTSAVLPGLATATASADVSAVLPGLATATASADESASLPGLVTATASAKESAVFPGLATATASADTSAVLPGLATATASAKESAVYLGLATATASADTSAVFPGLATATASADTSAGFSGLATTTAPDGALLDYG